MTRAWMLPALLSVLGLMTLTWVVSLARRNVSLIDGVWGLACALIGWVYVGVSGTVTARSVLAATLISVWGLRLSAYLSWRNWSGGEDWRYQRMREKAPKRFPYTSLVTVFWLQSLAAMAVTLPLLATVDPDQASALRLLDVAGVFLWTAGFLFEAVADRQLVRFKRDPASKGRLLDQGLWRYTRHPNYFGDAVLWWGVGLLGLSAGHWWALLGPAGMTAVLLWVTGKAPTEGHMRRTRGEVYEDYVQRTSSFIPMPPKKA